jgi:DNA primase large subunit
MQSNYDGGSNENRPSKNNYVELNDEESIELLAEIIANRIIEKLLYDENEQSPIKPSATRSGKERKAA